MTPRLKELFYNEIQQSLKSQFGYKNLYMATGFKRADIKCPDYITLLDKKTDVVNL